MLINWLGVLMIKMEIEELQKQIDEIVNKSDKFYGGKHDANSTFIHLIEEVGEIADVINEPNIRGRELNVTKLGKEISDSILFLVKLASIHNINLEEVIKNKIDELNERHSLK